MRTSHTFVTLKVCLIVLTLAVLWQPTSFWRATHANFQFGGSSLLLNFASVSANGMLISGTLRSTANTSFNVSFRTNPTCDPNGGSGFQITFASTTLTTNGAGELSFNSGFPTTLPAGTYIYAFARNNSTGTLLTSRCVAVIGRTVPTPTPTPVPTPTPTPGVTPTPVPTPVASRPNATPTPVPLSVPGLSFPADSAVSDQKLGSILVYPIYTSDAAGGATQNTQLHITNAGSRDEAYIHLFFVDGSNCNVADSFICLTRNQTATFVAGDFDPGTTGYLIAVATDARGCPTAYNALLGDLFVKFASGHDANLAAESFAALTDNPANCDGTSSSAEIRLDDVAYNRAPRVLAVDNILSRADGNDTLLIINRLGGDLSGGLGTLGSVSGTFYNDAETVLSFGFTTTACQFRSAIGNGFPRLTPRFETFIPQGRSGWFKFSASSGTGIVGAVINAEQPGATGAVYKSGHNLHKLTLSVSTVFTMPIFPPGCAN